MSVRVRFSQDRPDIAYVPSQKRTSTLVDDILNLPLPPHHQEKNFEMDIHTAASIGESNIIKELIHSGVSVNKANRSGWTPLLYAAYLGHGETCNLLIENGAQVDAMNSLSQTALMLSSACGNSTVVKILLAKGANGRRADQEGRQSLHYAASCSQNVIADSLLKAGCDPNAADVLGMTPVLEACQAAHELTLTALLDKGGDPYKKNHRGEDGELLAADAPKVLQLIKSYKKKGNSTIDASLTRQPDNLAELMDAMNLGRYLPRFEQERIDFHLFFSLTDKDLEEMGVAYGPKKRMLAVIERYRNTGVIQVDMPLPSAPPPYTDIVSETRVNQTKDSTPGNPNAFSRSILESTQLLAKEAMEALGHDETSERLRPLLTGIKDGLQQVLARINRT